MLATKIGNRFHRFYSNLLGNLVPYQYSRWGLTASLVLLYLERSYGMSYYIVTYLICFYVLQLVIGYCTPRGLEEGIEMDGTIECNSDVVQFRSLDSNEEGDEVSPLIPNLG